MTVAFGLMFTSDGAADIVLEDVDQPVVIELDGQHVASVEPSHHGFILPCPLPEEIVLRGWVEAVVTVGEVRNTVRVTWPAEGLRQNMQARRNARAVSLASSAAGTTSRPDVALLPFGRHSSPR